MRRQTTVSFWLSSRFSEDAGIFPATLEHRACKTYLANATSKDHAGVPNKAKAMSPDPCRQRLQASVYPCLRRGKLPKEMALQSAPLLRFDNEGGLGEKVAVMGAPLLFLLAEGNLAGAPAGT